MIGHLVIRLQFADALRVSGNDASIFYSYKVWSMRPTSMSDWTLIASDGVWRTTKLPAAYIGYPEQRRHLHICSFWAERQRATNVWASIKHISNISVIERSVCFKFESFIFHSIFNIQYANYAWLHFTFIEVCAFRLLFTPTTEQKIARQKKIAFFNCVWLYGIVWTVKGCHGSDSANSNCVVHVQYILRIPCKMCVWVVCVMWRRGRQRRAR